MDNSGWVTPIENSKGPMKVSAVVLLLVALVFSYIGWVLAASSPGPI